MYRMPRRGASGSTAVPWLHTSLSRSVVRRRAFCGAQSNDRWIQILSHARVRRGAEWAARRDNSAFERYHRCRRTNHRATSTRAGVWARRIVGAEVCASPWTSLCAAALSLDQCHAARCDAGSAPKTSRKHLCEPPDRRWAISFDRRRVYDWINTLACHNVPARGGRG